MTGSVEGNSWYPRGKVGSEAEASLLLFVLPPLEGPGVIARFPRLLQSSFLPLAPAVNTKGKVWRSTNHQRFT